MHKDKSIECLRYDARALAQLTEGASLDKTESLLGSLSIPPVFRAPYSYYEQCVLMYIKPNHDVLEIGSGKGLHTYVLTQTGARVIASDISRFSVKVLSRQIKGITTLVADMENLPFENNSFHVIACAGSLSYGDPMLVDAEIKRVLRPGGTFICVDSLNHNPVYRVNRWIHYKRGERTKSTLIFMPTMQRIRSLSQWYERVDVRYFGSLSYLMSGLALLIGQKRAAVLSDYFDRLVHVRRTAFKFVLAGC